nr:CLIP domain-containing serine protease B9 [Drosophila takahashii]
MGTVRWLAVCTILLFHQGSTHFLDADCGLVNSFDKSISAPWLAEIWSGSKFICPGTLISKRYVLAAASCIINLKKPVIRLGKSKDKNSYTDFNSTEGYIHYSYSEDRKENNIGMLRLEKEVEYSIYIRPICITTKPDNHKNRFTFEELIEKPDVGFFCGLSRSCVKNENAVKLLSKPIGSPWTKAIPDGPLQRYAQHGILSYHDKSKYAHVYTNIPAYSDWIELLALDAEIIIQDNKVLY